MFSASPLVFKRKEDTMNRQRINDKWLFTKDDHEWYQRVLNEEGIVINLPHTFNQEEIKTGEPIFRVATWYQKKNHTA